MKAVQFLRIVGAFRVLRRRVTEVGHPTLAMWADAGERAATEVRGSLSAAAHRAEVHDVEARQEIEAGLAGLADGRADAPDIEHLRRAARLVTHSAQLDHQIGEAVRS